MDTTEAFFTPIKRVFQVHPVYTVAGISLGFSVYRWNAKRVSDPIQICVPLSFCAEEDP